MSAARAISPLDGRYAERCAPLRAYFSEAALAQARVQVEVAHALALDETGLFGQLDEGERGRLLAAATDFDEADFERVKAIEATTRHDVKAIEYHLRAQTALRAPNRIHFGLTSEDVNNLAYSTRFAAFVREQQLPALDALLLRLAGLAESLAALPFPARTHGQPATPTTAGKELAVYASRLLRVRRALVDHRFYGKLNGATGTYAALLIAAPTVDWRSYERRLVSGLGLVPNPATTQIEDHDAWARWFHESRLLSSILVDLCRDVWLYISQGWIVQATRPGEVGSSTMPHKVNPIRFENAEGNLELSAALLSFLAEKLTRSRMQRDLSDSTVTRNVGVAFGHLMLAIDEIGKGLDAVAFDGAACLAAIEATPALLAEPIQTVMRLHHTEDPYGALRDLTRGQSISAEDLSRFVQDQSLPAEDKARLAALRPGAYLGAAAEIALEVAASVRAAIGGAP